MVRPSRNRHAGDMTKKTRTPGAGLDPFYDGLRRPGIMRAVDDKWFAGVCTGVARWLGIDPLVVRGAFILFAVFFGMGVALYLVLWMLMPNENGDISLERALKHGDGGSIFLLVITVMSVLGGGPWFGDGGFRGVRIGGIVVVAVLAWWFLTRTDAGRGLVAASPWGPRPDGDGPAFETEGQTNGSGDSSAFARHPAGGLSTGNAAAAAGVGSSQWAPAPTPPKAQVRTRSIGFAATLVVLGAALAGAAVITSVAQTGGWSGNHLTLGAGVGLAVVGLAIVIGGMLGRRAGVLAPVAILSMVFLALAAVLPAGVSRPWDVGERNTTVTTLSGQNDYQLGLGELTLDLTTTDYAKTSVKPDVVQASLGVGQLNVHIPTGTSVVVQASGRAGEVAVFTPAAAKANQDNAGTGAVGGTNWSHTYTFGQGTPELTIKAEVGLGQIRIITGSTP